MIERIMHMNYILNNFLYSITMNTKIIATKLTPFLIAGLFVLVSIHADAEDYQYHYFQKEKDEFVPFSDYIPKVRMHYKVVPHYVEDFYELYGMKLYYDENSLRKNIDRLKIALTCKFRHPSQALIKIQTEDEYYKYRNLMFMHITMLILRDYLKIATRYDKQHIYFYDVSYAKDIQESLKIAEIMYREALPYWYQAKKYASIASTVKITTNLGYIETERVKIIRGDVDFEKIINDHINRVKKKQNSVDALLATYQK